MEKELYFKCKCGGRATNRVLDKYYTKKLMEELKDYLDVFNIDKRIVYYKNGATLEIKKRKWRDENYKEIFYCEYDKGFMKVINLSVSDISRLRKYVEEKIKE